MFKRLILQPTFFLMIRNILFVLFLACAGIVSCNNSDEAALPSKEKELREAIAQHPDSLILTENLIQYFRDNHNFGNAIGETEKAIRKDSTNDRLWDIKATLHFENADTLHAIKSFEQAIALSPQPAYLMSLASLYAQTKNVQALGLANRLLTMPKAGAEKQAYFIKGLYYSYSGEKEKAIPFFDTCLAIDYTNVLAYREKGICLYDLGKYEAAIAVIEKAVALQSNYDEGYYWLGRCYQKLNQPGDAIENYKAAIAIDPDYAEAKDAMVKMNAK